MSTGTGWRVPIDTATCACGEQNPVDWQAGHGISNRLGGADVIILQSTYRNQIQSARLERHGAVSKDEYYNIGGIAVDPLTAWDLYNRGLLAACRRRVTQSSSCNHCSSEIGRNL